MKSVLLSLFPALHKSIKFYINGIEEATSATNSESLSDSLKKFRKESYQYKTPDKHTGALLSWHMHI